ncbi:MAG: hypothetical protein HYY62_03860, partial [Deltaproteobacteria bacterium]|nr:hypothetical protein [Deltaproteobacteria bacterium]
PNLSEIDEAVSTLRREKSLDIEVKDPNLGVREDGSIVFIDTNDIGDMTRRFIRGKARKDPFSPPTQTLKTTTTPLKPGDEIYFTYKTRAGEIRREKLGTVLSIDEATMGPKQRASAKELDLLPIRLENGAEPVMERSYAEAMTRQPYLEIVPAKPSVPPAPVHAPPPAPHPVPVTPAPRRDTAVLLSEPCVKRFGREDPCIQLHDYFSALPEENEWRNHALDTISEGVSRRGGELTPAERYLLAKARDEAQELYPDNVGIEDAFNRIGVEDPREALSSHTSLSELKKDWQELRKSIEAMPKESAQTQTLLLKDLDKVYADRIRNLGLVNLGKSDSIATLKRRWQNLGEYVGSIPNPQARQRLINTINIVYVNGVQYQAKKILGGGSNAYIAFNRLVPAPILKKGVLSISHPQLNLGTALLENTYKIRGRPLSQKEVFDILERLHRTNPSGYDNVIDEMMRTLQKDGAESLNGHIYQAHVGTKYAHHPKKIVKKITYEPPVPATPGGTEGRADMIFEYWTGRNSLIETKASLAFEEATDQGRKLKAQLERYAHVLREDIPIDGVHINFVEIHSPYDTPAPWIDKFIDELNTTLPEGKQIKLEATP